MSQHTKIALSVNLNKIALIRNSREGNFPDIDDFAKLCAKMGAQGITVHPRPDQRHIRAADIPSLRKICSAAKMEFNIEGNPLAPARGDYPGLISLAERSKPDQCTLVPDNDSQKTSDHGFDLTKDFDALAPIVSRLKCVGIRVSLFMDPDIEQIDLAKKVGADRIELYTGPFASAFAKGCAEAIFDQHVAAAQRAKSIGLGINAGHDLNLQNMAVYRSLPGLQEVSIGHALTVDALLNGFEQTIKEYLKICS